jgi:hypothetical protein
LSTKKLENQKLKTSRLEQIANGILKKAGVLPPPFSKNANNCSKDDKKDLLPDFKAVGSEATVRVRTLAVRLSIARRISFCRLNSADKFCFIRFTRVYTQAFCLYPYLRHSQTFFCYSCFRHSFISFQILLWRPPARPILYHLAAGSPD